MVENNDTQTQEKKKDTEEPQEEPKDKPVDTPEGIQSKTVSTLDRADEIAERQERANAKRIEILDREEALAARKAVGGVTDAGQVIEKKEETPKEYNDRIEKELSEGKHDD